MRFRRVAWRALRARRGLVALFLGARMELFLGVLMAPFLEARALGEMRVVRQVPVLVALCLAARMAPLVGVSQGALVSEVSGFHEPGKGLLLTGVSKVESPVEQTALFQGVPMVKRAVMARSLEARMARFPVAPTAQLEVVSPEVLELEVSELCETEQALI